MTATALAQNRLATGLFPAVCVAVLFPRKVIFITCNRTLKEQSVYRHTGFMSTQIREKTGKSSFVGIELQPHAKVEDGYANIRTWKAQRFDPRSTDSLSSTSTFLSRMVS